MSDAAPVDDSFHFEVKTGMSMDDIESQPLELLETLVMEQLPLRYQNEGMSEGRVYLGGGKEYRVYYDGQIAAHVSSKQSDRKLRDDAEKIATGVSWAIKIGLIALVAGSYVMTYFVPWFAFKAISALGTLALIYFFFIDRDAVG